MYERSDDYVAYAEFQKFLDHFGTPDNETFYNVLDVMMKVWVFLSKEQQQKQKLNPKCLF